MRQTNRIDKRIDRLIADDELDRSAEWYLTVRCARSTCGRLIAFQKAIFPGDKPNLRFAVTGEPSVNCPHCRLLVRIRVDDIERRRIVVMQ